MSAPSLAAFQADFAAALAAADPAARPRMLAGESAERFKVYRNNVHHGLGQALAEAYPVVRRLIGDAAFLAAARVFVPMALPRRPSLALYGEGFADFLMRFDALRHLTYLPDVACLERAVLEARHEADCAPLDPASLAALGEALGDARLVAHPATRLVVSPHPVAEIWKANLAEGEGARRRIVVGAAAALVTRPAFEVMVRALSPAELLFARALLAGKPVSEAHAVAAEGHPDFDVSAIFRVLLAAGAFARLR